MMQAKPERDAHRRGSRVFLFLLLSRRLSAGSGGKEKSMEYKALAQDIPQPRRRRREHCESGSLCDTSAF